MIIFALVAYQEEVNSHFTDKKLAFNSIFFPNWALLSFLGNVTF